MDIERFLVHRPPFRFVDEVASLEDGGGVFRLVLTANDERLRDGHFPPLFVIEALAQSTAAYFGARTSDKKPESGVLVEISDAELLAVARAGDTVVLRIQQEHLHANFVRFFGEARSRERTLARARITVARTPLGPLP